MLVCSLAIHQSSGLVDPLDSPVFQSTRILGSIEADMPDWIFKVYLDQFYL